MPISEADKKRIDSICKYLREGRYDFRFDGPTIEELRAICYRYDGLALIGRSFCGCFERYERLKQPGKKAQAWSRVMDQVYRIQTVASMTIPEMD